MSFASKCAREKQNPREARQPPWPNHDEGDLFITTGGTIEKVYSERTGAVCNVSSKIDRYLRLLRLPDADIHIVPLMNIDSLEMTEQDRLLLLGTVRAILTENAPVVITHGTDTMVESGQHLKRALPGLRVPIVMTGAMTPLGFEGSDGLQNLTESVLAVRLLSPGIYVVMHGQIFPVDRVRKDHASSSFIWTESPRL
jgi:L-asparaginase